jgi:hypothetical protein
MTSRVEQAFQGKMALTRRFVGFDEGVCCWRSCALRC